MLSVLIPARNEQFLEPTIRDVLDKAEGDIEVIAILDGYWPPRDEIVDDPRVNYIHFGKARGMRPGLNAACAIASGELVMKLDAHCMVSPGFDTVLARVCRPNWVCVPTRHRLDPENWRINNGGRPAINYLRVDLSNDEFNGKLWREKNKDESLEKLRIDDIIACQGSSYCMHKAHWERLGLLDVEHYGTFRKDPQEVLFKTWTSGGRCVRVKDAWYAHLHKGKRYGRGYSTKSADWRKGDEYVKRWWTDDAWDERQKIPLGEVFQKFSDMPGWEDHPWMQGDEPEPNTSKLPRLYQVLEVNGKPFSRPRPRRTESEYWNEEKWENFIAPLLDEDASEQTLVEMGCDAGLFLRMAADHGFGRVIGIEKNKTPVRYGKEYRDTLGYEYEILKRKLGSKFHERGTFDIDELPVVDVTLMSTFHYYIDINAWLKYIERLRTKTCSVLIVSRESLRDEHWKAKASLEAVRGYFDGWEELGLVRNLVFEDDPSPRKLYAVRLASPLIRRVAMTDVDVREGPNDPMRKAMDDLARLVVSGADFDPLETEYAQRWRERKKGKWSDRTLHKFVHLKTGVMRGVAENGLMDAIIVERDTLRLCDGGHRLAVFRAQGRESVIVRET